MIYIYCFCPLQLSGSEIIWRLNQSVECRRRTKDDLLIFEAGPFTTRSLLQVRHTACTLFRSVLWVSCRVTETALASHHSGSPWWLARYGAWRRPAERCRGDGGDNGLQHFIQVQLSSDAVLREALRIKAPHTARLPSISYTCSSSHSEHRFPAPPSKSWRKDVVNQCLEFGSSFHLLVMVTFTFWVSHPRETDRVNLLSSENIAAFHSRLLMRMLCRANWRRRRGDQESEQGQQEVLELLILLPTNGAALSFLMLASCPWDHCRCPCCGLEEIA